MSNNPLDHVQKLDVWIWSNKPAIKKTADYIFPALEKKCLLRKPLEIKQFSLFAFVCQLSPQKKAACSKTYGLMSGVLCTDDGVILNALSYVTKSRHQKEQDRLCRYKCKDSFFASCKYARLPIITKKCRSNDRYPCHGKDV